MAFRDLPYTKGKAPVTATCNKAGQPNDVCPRGQVMSASPGDVAKGYTEAILSGQMQLDIAAITAQLLRLKRTNVTIVLENSVML